MEPNAVRFVRSLAQRLKAARQRLVIDADTHITDISALTGQERQSYEARPDYYHGRPISAEDLVREMDLAEVDMALVWQNPAATHYTSDQDRNAEALLAANRYVREAALRFPQRLIPAGWTDPKACGLGNALRLAEICVKELGFPVVKMNPAQNGYAIDSPEALAVTDRLVELGAAPAVHFGADTAYTPAEGLERMAARHPDHPVMAVHMGGGGAGYLRAEPLYQQARRLGLERPNIRFVLSAKRDTHMESDFVAYEQAGEPYSHNLFCGSDAPYGRIAWNFGGFRWMLRSLTQNDHAGRFTSEAAANYLGRNLARFILARCERLLAMHAPAAAGPGPAPAAGG